MTVLDREGASGAPRSRASAWQGFLLGAPARGRPGARTSGCRRPGHAVTEPELVRDLYAAAAERWVADGRTSHYAIVPATDGALVDAWFRLGFGHQHVHAIREAPEPDERRTPSGRAR